jgi:hypothetical protein
VAGDERREGSLSLSEFLENVGKGGVPLGEQSHMALVVYGVYKFRVH